MKESEFFSRSDEFDRGLDHYNRQWLPLFNFNGWALEASTGYSKFPSIIEIPERIARTLKSVKFIYVMRNPVDRMFSHLNHNISDGLLKHKKLFEFSDLQHYLNVSQYYTQLERYTRLFPKESIMLISFEELVQSPIRTARSVCEFLGVDASFPFEALPAANVGKVLSSMDFSQHAWQQVRCVIGRELSKLERNFEFDTSIWKNDLTPECRG